MKFEITVAIVAVVIVIVKEAKEVQALPGCLGGLCGWNKNEGPIPPQTQKLNKGKRPSRELQELQGGSRFDNERNQAIRAELAATPTDHETIRLAQRQKDTLVQQQARKELKKELKSEENYPKHNHEEGSSSKGVKNGINNEVFPRTETHRSINIGDVEIHGGINIKLSPGDD